LRPVYLLRYCQKRKDKRSISFIGKGV
jgi:hypothetical protein